MGRRSAAGLGIIAALIIWISWDWIWPLILRPSFKPRVRPRHLCRTPKCVLEIRHEAKNVDSWEVSIGTSGEGPWRRIAWNNTTVGGDYEHVDDIESSIESGWVYAHRITADNDRLAGNDSWWIRFQGIAGHHTHERIRRVDFIPSGGTLPLPTARRTLHRGDFADSVEREWTLGASGKVSESVCAETHLRSITINEIVIDDALARTLNEQGWYTQGPIELNRNHRADVLLTITASGQEYVAGALAAGQAYTLDSALSLDAPVHLRASMRSGDEGEFQQGYDIFWEWSAELQCTAA